MTCIKDDVIDWILKREFHNVDFVTFGLVELRELLEEVHDQSYGKGYDQGFEDSKTDYGTVNTDYLNY